LTLYWVSVAWLAMATVDHFGISGLWLLLAAAWLVAYLLARFNSSLFFLLEVASRIVELTWLYSPLVPLLILAKVADLLGLRAHRRDLELVREQTEIDTWVDLWWKVTLRRVQRSGPVFVKLCQWAATRKDLIPEDICSHLGRLHDATEPHPLEHTHKVLRESFGEQWFQSFLIEPKPIGSGCIAQVYPGWFLPTRSATPKRKAGWGFAKLGSQVQRLCGGACSGSSAAPTKVAVKVVHPQVRRAVQVDLKVLDHLAGLSSYIGMDRLGLPMMLQQFSAFLKAQTDLRIEAQNLRRLRQQLCSKDKTIVIPEVYDDWVSRDVLVMTYEEGQPLNTLLEQEEQEPGQGERERLEAWRILVDTFWAMVFRHRFVHGDLHPGNILWRRPHDRAPMQLVLLDCGLVIDLRGDAGEDLSMMVKAFLTKSEEEVASLLIQLSERVGGKVEDVLDPDGFVKGIADLIRSGKSVGFRLSKLNAGSLMGQSLLLGRKHSVRFDARFVNLMAAMVVVQGVALHLNGDGDLFTRMYSFVFEAAVSQLIS